MKEIHLSRKGIRHQDKFIAYVDDKDFEMLSKHTWSVWTSKTHRLVYATTKVGRKNVYMHRMILKNDLQIIDHIDGNGLNNCRANLRIANFSINNQNRAVFKSSLCGFKGVTFIKKNNRFMARICKDRKRVFLGLFNTSIEAAKAYNQKAIELFGSNARLNNV